MKYVLWVALVVLLAAPVAAQTTVRADRFVIANACTLRSGSGDPNGAVVGTVCDTYWRTDTGVIYTKTSGSGNTGWTTPGVSGSGTPGTLPIWTGTTVLGDSMISQVGNDIILNPTGKDVLPNLSYDINLGSLQKKYLTLHAAELWVETLVAQSTMATIGGRILVAPTNILVGDLTAGATTVTVKYNNFASGDRIYMEADGKVEFMAVTSGASGPAGAYVYSVTRNLDGSGANQWYGGDAILNTGTTGNGFMDIYSTRGVKAGTEVGPTIVGNVRNSSTYNDWAPRWAIGNLNGLYGYGTTTYGSAFGVPGGARITMDSTNGIRIFGGDNDEKVTIDTSGNATFDGKLTVGTGRNVVRNSECRVGTDDWTVYAGTTGQTPVLGFYLTADYGLSGEATTCFSYFAGTPAAATLSYLQNTQKLAVVPGARYEASAYLGLYRLTNAHVYIAWWHVDGSLFDTSIGSNCAGADPADLKSLSQFCRSGIVVTAPAGAAYATINIETTHVGGAGGATPFTFFVRAYFGEASVAQTQLTEWGPAGITEIIGGLIKTGTVTADKITVSTLAAIKADLGSITAGSIVVGTTDKMWLNEGADGILAVGGATKASAPFRVAANGALTATSASISGAITSTSGTIGGFTIGSDYMLSGSGASQVGMSSGGSCAFWAGGATCGSAPYRVNASGGLTATSATITGTITGSSITGSTAVFGGSGGEVGLGSDGITIDSGTGDGNKLKWTDTNYIQSYSGTMYIKGTIVALSTGSLEIDWDGGALWSANHDLGKSIAYWANLYVNDAYVSALAGGGDHRTVCADNSGKLFTVASGAAC